MPPNRKSKKDESPLGTPADFSMLLRELQKAEGDEGGIAVDISAAKAINDELHKRRMDIAKLYRPFPPTAHFHKSQSPQRLAIGSNRSGKTVACAWEVAMILRGEHPWHNPSRIPRKNGRAACVALKHEQLGEVIYEKLFRSGSFDIIHDERTDQWRPVVAEDPYDKARKDDWTPAPPMIPDSMVDDVAFHDAKRRQMSLVMMKNGWKMSCHSSEGTPATGDERHLVWFDEHIVNGEFYSETAVRATAKHHGMLVWSACPQSTGIHLHECAMRAQNPATKHLAELFKFSIYNNTGLSKEAIDNFVSLCPPSERKWRVEGDFAIDSMVVYPEFREDVHIIKGFDIPHDWTKYAFIDPGYQVCAVVFIAIPPKESPRRHEIHVFRELYLTKTSPRSFAQAMYAATEGYNLEGMYIDRRSAQRHSEGGRAEDGTIGEQYARELANFNVRCHRHGNSFGNGHDGVEVRENATRAMMHDHPQKGVRLRIHSGCHQVPWELKRQYYKSEKVGNQTRVSPRRLGMDDHTVWGVECACYAVEQGIVCWEEPHRPVSVGNRMFERLMEMRRHRREGDIGNVGPSGVWLGPTHSKARG